MYTCIQQYVHLHTCTCTEIASSTHAHGLVQPDDCVENKFSLQLIPHSKPQLIHTQAINLTLPVTKSHISLHFQFSTVKVHVSIKPIKMLMLTEKMTVTKLLVGIQPGILQCTAHMAPAIGLKWWRGVNHQRYPSRFSLYDSSFHLEPLSVTMPVNHIFKCLNSELMLYQESRLFGGSLPRCEHVGYSQWFCFDSYKSMDMKTHIKFSS